MKMGNRRKTKEQRLRQTVKNSTSAKKQAAAKQELSRIELFKQYAHVMDIQSKES